MRFVVLIVLFIMMVGVDAEFISFALYGGLLKGSEVGIFLIIAICVAANFGFLRAMWHLYKGK